MAAAEAEPAAEPRMQASKAAKINAAYVAVLPEIKARSALLTGPSLAEELLALDAVARDAILAQLSPQEYASLWYEWAFWARPKQRPPPGEWWRWMLYMAGRGSGKSRTGSEFMRDRVEHGAETLALAGPTYNHVLHFMLGGRRGKKGNGSGLLDVFPKHQKPRYFKQDKLVEFHTGAIAYVLTGEDQEPRGANLSNVWIDEPIKFKNIGEFFYNIELTLRADEVTPQGIITTTPKPIEWLKRIIARKTVYVVLGSTDENKANLAATYIAAIEEELGGSRTERQERHGEIVEDDEGERFRLKDIEGARVARTPPLTEIMVSVDPSATDTDRADECGVIGVGADAAGELYVLDDRSGKLDPEGYGTAAIEMYFELRRRHPQARVSILVEDNKIGKHAKSTVRAAARDKRGSIAAESITIAEVHAVGDKGTRADPVSTLYRKGLVHHVGQLPDVENEITTWRPGKKSPGRLDALVHACTKLARLDEDPLPPVEDPSMVHAESRWAPKDQGTMRSEEWEEEDEADKGAWR